MGVQLCLAGGRSEGNKDYEFYELNVCVFVCVYVCECDVCLICVSGMRMCVLVYVIYYLQET